jgi:hypothetical protein
MVVFEDVLRCVNYYADDDGSRWHGALNARRLAILMDAYMAVSTGIMMALIVDLTRSMI